MTLSVTPGEIFGLIGPNGAGKSTLIKMLTTLLPPTSGTAQTGGCDIVRQPEQVRRQIGYVPQLLSADGSLTGNENMLLSARLYGIPRREQGLRISAALAAMGLADAAIFYGISAIWERHLGVLHRHLVSPAPRSALVPGKAIPAGVRGLSQAVSFTCWHCCWAPASAFRRSTWPALSRSSCSARGCSRRCR